MPSNYTGSATATQAPASQPDPDSVPIAALPVDGDGANAASVAQAFKVLADYIAWEKSPRAKASSWPQPIKKYRNAAIQSRFMVDHLGFPSGKILQWDEDWGGQVGLTTPGLTTPGTVVALLASGLPRWQIHIDTFGQIIFLPPATAFLANPSLVTGHFSLGNNAAVGSNTLTMVNPAIMSTADIAISYQWDEYISVGGAGLASAELVGGLTDTAFPGAGAFSTLGVTGCAFVKRAADANWQCYRKAAAGGAAYADSGVAVAPGNTKIRKRIEIIGASASDTATGQVNFYINGAQVGSFAESPTIGSGLYPWFRASCTAIAGGTIAGLLVGPSQFRANLWAGDVAL